ncbi:MAG: alpha/beta fold hydrolase [Woeseiaceae bacterium]
MYFEVNGKRAFASTGGKPFDSTQPTVVFLHGSGLDHTFWGLHSRFFAFRKYSVLAPDLPGHTSSEGPPLQSIEDMASWLHDVLDTVDAKDVSLIAHSQGCLVALEYAARFKDKIKSVSFVASGLATPVNSALIEAAGNNPDAAITMMLSWGFGRAGHLHQGPVPGNSMAGGGRKVMRGNVPGALAADLKACNAYANGKSAAAGIECPVQVILAGKDRMAPRKAVMQLVEHLPEPRLHVLEDCGHMIPQEMPDATRQILKDFVFQVNPAF